MESKLMLWLYWGTVACQYQVRNKVGQADLVLRHFRALHHVTYQQHYEPTRLIYESRFEVYNK